MKIELKCGRDDCETVTTDQVECCWCIEIERVHYNATIERLEAKLAEADRDRDETFGELNERNMYIVRLEEERDEAIKEIGKQARGRGYAEQERDELQKKNTMMLSLMETQAVTILSMRNCGNCAEKNGSSGARRICIGCHGFEGLDLGAKKTYLAKWRPGKQEVK